MLIASALLSIVVGARVAQAGACKGAVSSGDAVNLSTFLRVASIHVLILRLSHRKLVSRANACQKVTVLTLEASRRTTIVQTVGLPLDTPFE